MVTVTRDPWDDRAFFFYKKRLWAFDGVSAYLACGWSRSRKGERSLSRRAKMTRIGARFSESFIMQSEHHINASPRYCRYFERIREK